MGAKLPAKSFAFAADNGETLQFSAAVSVNEEGVFSLSLPGALEEPLRSVLSGHAEAEQFKAARLVLRRPRQALYLSGANLRACERAIKLAADELLRCEVVRERVIVYSVDAKLSYMTDETGGFFANGYDVGAPRDGRHWRGTLNATSRASAYSVGFAARVLDRITHRRASGVRVAYEEPHDLGLMGSDESYAARLNAFAGLALDPARMRQMPYTEEAARFMYETMIGLCRLGERLQAFFGNEPRLREAIERQTPLLALQPEPGQAAA
jgi:hypothetical protein